MTAVQEKTALPSAEETDPRTISRGLGKVRQRRWLLWVTIFIYLPGLYLALESGLPGGTLAKLFWAWVGLLCVVVGMATVVKCPRCHNSYHTNGPTFLPVRKCLHCGLHLKADKTPAKQVDIAQ